ncbi:MAG: type II toxin-antitoxin system VapC family toxin [bacterium]
MMDTQLRILDTDTLSLIQRRNQVVMNRLESLPTPQVATTIVTVEEQMRGWVAKIKKEKRLERLIPIYESFQTVVLAYSQVPILPFDDKAAYHFQKLRYLQTRLGLRDLRIAAIALACDGILVTANVRHFRQIPGLTIEDWTAA